MQTDYLFVGFDAGETNIWTQLLSQWPQKDYQVLTMATATKLAQQANLARTIPIETYGIACSAQDRLYQLSQADLDKLEAIRAKVLVTGMFSTPQMPIFESF